MKLKLLPGSLVIFLMLAIVLVLAQESPPPLADFHQLYGQVSGLPAGTFTLRASVGGNNYTTSIGAEGKYGYSPTFKVYGQDGQAITFTLVSSLGLSTALETTVTFQSGAFSAINLQYPPAGEEPAAEIFGCMNETATNYNANATVDDGSCQFVTEPAGEVEGCMHANATNYNASVTKDDESCVFPSGIIVGCRNESAFNYNASATIQYGKCIFRRGCTNETAVNYNASAMINDGSCRFNVTAALPCLMNWECSGWSACLNEQQTRSCLRVDNCDIQVARGNATLTAVPKPEESKYCPVATETARICTPDAKRCSGVNLEQCSFDGRQWNLLQSCPLGCNSFTMQCREETLPPAEPTVTKEERKPFPAWIIYLLAALVVAGAIGAGVFFVLRQKKYAPLKKYIQESRSEGFPDQQIKSRLINQGWDPEKINKLLK